MAPAVTASSSQPYNDNTMNAQSSCNPSSILLSWTSTYNTYVFNYGCIATDCFYQAQGGHRLSESDICGSNPTCTVFLEASQGYTNATVYTAIDCQDALDAPTGCEGLLQDTWQVG